MKHLFTLLLLLTANCYSYAQITWGTPVTVTTASGSNLHPRIALNRSGNPYILWGQTDTRAYFSKWNGSGFTTPVVPSGSLTIFAQSWAGPDIAAYGDTVYVSMKVTPENINTNYSYLAHSFNGGTSFSAPVRIDNIDTNLSRFPIVTATPNGNPLVAFMKFNASFLNAHYVVSRSTDYGMTFSTDVLASGSAGTVCDCCPAAILAPAGSTAVMLFRNNLSNIRDMWTGVSSDGGATFTSNFAVDNTNWNVSSCPASGPDGFVVGDSIYTVFMSAATGTSLAYLSRSSMSASSSSTSAITGMFSGLTSQNYPRIANAGNAATAVWLQNTTSGKSIACTFTNNISSGFSGYATVTGATGSGIMNADVAMAPGVVHVVWEDDNTGKVMYMKGTYIPTNIDDVSGKEEVVVYPNPATESFSVALRNVSIMHTYLSDYSGRETELKPQMVNGKIIYCLDGVANGGYILSVEDAGGKRYYSKLSVGR